MKDIYTLHTELKNKKISAVEAVKDCLSKLKKSNCNSFISVLEDKALVDAQTSQDEIQKNGPKNYLHGVPYSLKDLFITKDIRTTAGSKILYNYIPPYDGYMSEQFKKAGGVLVGKVGCDQFGMGSTNENTPFGVVLNPLNKDYVAGGSSGGSAASVAEGSSYFSIGTDTGGSTRLPANFCGIVGYKPSYGRVSRYGQIAYGSSLDQSAPIAKTVLDMGCIISNITEKDPRDTTNVPLPKIEIVNDLVNMKASYLKGKKIGLPAGFIDACDADIKKNLLAAIDEFKKLGAEMVDVTLPNAKYCVSTYYLIATSEASANLARFDGIHYGHRDMKAKDGIEQTYVKSRTQGFGEEVKRRIILGTFSLSSGYQDQYFAKACKVRRKIYNDFQTAFKSCDVIFSPVCASNAFKIGQSDNDPIKMYMNDLYTIPVNLAGLPGIALPYGKGANQLPTGFQLIGKTFQDAELLKIARAFEVRA
ncbi:MAG: Asp-tRNA(Asn)/Glu-tRNA(Gln) amidotransferase subunit GatA [Bacteriovoracaceae bacterium]|nr:Asp-tRNA(Asn)/Glu-tRNA(Gln) amidotransferase subunit GatA [Bacteriovoracaceae bacterium]